MRFCGGRSTPAIRAMRAPSFFEKLSLALLVLRVHANHAHDPAAVDDFTFVTNLFDRCPNFHFSLLAKPAYLLIPINDAATRQVVGRKLDGHLVSGENANEIL